MKSALIIGVILLAFFVWSNVGRSVKADPMGNDTAVTQNKDATQRLGISPAPGINHVSADDKVILESIQKFLATDKDISLATENIVVTVFNGFVTLKGAVKDKDEKAAIEHKVQGIEHVRHVDNQLVIEI